MKRLLEWNEVPSDAVLVDARAQDLFAASHVPGARHAEFMDKFIIRSLEQLEAFNTAVQTLVRSLGLRGTEHVAVYDAGRETRAARLAWALEYAGFTEVGMLRTGLNGYTGTLETSSEPIAPSDFTLEHPRRELLATADEILGRDSNVIVLDARSADEYSGAKPIAGSDKAGHIPGARSLDWQRLTDGRGIADDAAIQKQLEDIPADAEVIVHCQSGARSSVLYQALKSRGVNVKNYIGSMNEWAQEDLPLEMGDDANK
jgi:thiosulfate/3-mercaptopyruvate sulfurtransferase